MTLQTLLDIFLNLEGKHQEVIVDRQAERDIRRKLKVPEFAKECGNKAFACRKFGISRETFYQWKRAYEAKGEAGLLNSKPCPKIQNCARRLKLKKKFSIYVHVA